MTMNILIRVIATGCFTGYVPRAPGTAGSALAILLVWGIAPTSTLPYVGMLIISISIAVWVSGQAERQYGYDGRQIVIDEIIGVFVTMAFLPLTPLSLGLGFVMFRIMDIVKPFPIKRLEQLPGGAGVVADDFLAGVYAHLLVRVMLVMLA